MEKIIMQVIKIYLKGILQLEKIEVIQCNHKRLSQRVFIPVVFIIQINLIHHLQYNFCNSQNDLFIWRAILKQCPSNVHVALLKS